MRAIGDLASLMMSSRENTMLRRSSDVAAQDATLGKVSNIAHHLQGTVTSVALLERKLELLNQYQFNARETQNNFSVKQNSLEAIVSTVEEFSEKAVVSIQAQNNDQIQLLSRMATDAFNDVVNKLNTKSAGKYIFSGSATSTRPLPDGQQILSQIKQDVPGINATSSFGVAIDDWFQAINGAYQASIYSGSEQDTIFTPIGVGKGVVSEVDASHEAITTLLKGLAKIAVVSDTVLQANASDQQNILKNGLEDISAAMPMLPHVQSLIGVSQEHISSAIEENDAYLFIYEKSQNSLIGVDQYQRLSEHQAIQTQIGISYQILTWRTKNTLADYLR